MSPLFSSTRLAACHYSSCPFTWRMAWGGRRRLSKSSVTKYDYCTYDDYYIRYLPSYSVSLALFFHWRERLEPLNTSNTRIPRISISIYSSKYFIDFASHSLLFLFYCTTPSFSRNPASRLFLHSHACLSYRTHCFPSSNLLLFLPCRSNATWISLPRPRRQSDCIRC